MAADPRGVTTGPSPYQQGVSQWQIFNELDLKEEAEMLDLARFLDSVIGEFTVKHRKDSIQQLNALEDDDDDDESSVRRAEAQEQISRGSDLRRRPGASSSTSSSGKSPAESAQQQDAKSLNRAAVSGSNVNIVGKGPALPPDANIENYGPLPKGPLAPETASNIIEVYRRKGKLSMKSVKKLLRDEYKVLKTIDNIVPVSVDSDEEVIHVIGDLHGQLTDLLHILDDAGMPSPNNKFIFNGDYVDRGPCSVEIVMILFAMHLAWPNCVFLNRGNHEDHAICCQPPPPHGCGGFQKEMKMKYDDLIFSMVVEVFRYLPLVHILDDKVFIVHGGLFYRPGVTLADIMAIDRLDYCAAPGQEAIPTTPEEERAQDLKQLMRDALWSDPRDTVRGVEFNTARRQGQFFGPDVTRSFLEDNGLLMVVRSHECVKRGFHQPFRESPADLCTIFSASGYSGSNNLGAYMTFSRMAGEGRRAVGGERAKSVLREMSGSGGLLYFSIHAYTCAEASDSLEESNKTSLRALLIRVRQDLLAEFTALDEERTGRIRLSDWSNIMCEVTGVAINWNEILPLLGSDNLVGEDGYIDYKKFISNLRSGLHKLKQVDDGDALMNAMYANRNILEVVFNFFDTNGDGVISREEFQTGCKKINSRLPEDKKIQDPDYILNMMDIDGNEGIDLNEFFEVFRIVDAMDGSVDGNIGLLAEAE